MFLRSFLILTAWLCYLHGGARPAARRADDDLLRRADHHHGDVGLHARRRRCRSPAGERWRSASSASSSPAIRPISAFAAGAAGARRRLPVGPVDRAAAQDRHAGKDHRADDPQQQLLPGHRRPAADLSLADAVARARSRLLFGAGSLAGFAQFTLFEGMKRAPASVIAPFEYTALVWSFLLGYLIWSDVPRSEVFVGAVDDRRGRPDHHRQRAFPQAHAERKSGRSAFKKNSKKIVAAWNHFPAPRVLCIDGSSYPPRRTPPTRPLTPAGRKAGFLFASAASLPQASANALAPDRSPSNALTLPALALPSAAKRTPQIPHGDDGGRCGMILTGAIVAGLLAAYLAVAGIVASRLAIDFRQALLYAAVQARLADRRPRHPPGLARRRSPVIYVVAHQSKIDPALMLTLLPDNTLHILDDYSANAVWLEPFRNARPHHRLQRRACVRVAPAGAPVEGQRPARRLFPRRRSSPAPRLSASTGRSPRSPPRPTRRIVPIVIGGARHLPFSNTPAAKAPRSAVSDVCRSPRSSR